MDGVFLPHAESYNIQLNSLRERFKRGSFLC